MHSLYTDPLALLSEEDLRAPPTPIVEKISRFDKFWYKRFKYDLYDWSDPEWNRKNRGRYAWKPIVLTQGYFMMVSSTDYPKMTEYPNGKKRRWCVHIKKNNEGDVIAVYACRGGRKGEPKFVLAHRELANALHAKREIVDHMNGRGLDNRIGTVEKPVNLRRTNRSENNHNTGRVREDGLPTGVEQSGKMFVGKVCKRGIDKQVTTLRSKKYPTAELASRWYRRVVSLMHRGRKNWTFAPTRKSYPQFPPLLKLPEVPF